MQNCADLFSPEEDKSHAEGELCQGEIQKCVGQTGLQSEQSCSTCRHYLNEGVPKVVPASSQDSLLAKCEH